jgi:hypothetical protein
MNVSMLDVLGPLERDVIGSGNSGRGVPETLASPRDLDL